MNKFGGYKYRSCEDIVEAVKPLLASEGLAMTITDELTQIGDRYYIKATVTIIDTNESDRHEVNGYAREAENKKGMDVSQITGAASSYARKYALNGMFAIDDTKDADDLNKHGKSKKQSSSKKQAKINYPAAIRKLAKEDNEIMNTVKSELDKLNKNKLDQLNDNELEDVYNLVNGVGKGN